MQKDLLLLLAAGMLMIAAAASAQVNSQTVVTPNATVTTVQSPGESVTTKVTTIAGKSVVTQFKDGTPVELDSDGTVHQLYPDGARVNAPDGVHILKDGTSITIKDGHRIP